MSMLDYFERYYIGNDVSGSRIVRETTAFPISKQNMT